MPNIPPESIAAFMREMQSLASTEVGKAVIPPQTLANIMHEMRQNAEEILSADGGTSTNPHNKGGNNQTVRVKSEFSDNADNQRSDQQQGDGTNKSLFAFNHPEL